MSIATETSAARFEGIVADTPVNNNYPLYDEDEVEVIYGSQLLRAVPNTDYTVTLSPPNYNSFTVTPLASLLTKINALVAAPPTDADEENYIVVKRKLPYTTTATPELVRNTQYLSDEVDRIHMKLLWLKERVERSLSVAETVIGTPSTTYIIGVPDEGKAPVWRGNTLVPEIDATNIENAEGFAAEVADLKVDVETLRDEVQTLRDEAEDYKLAAEAAAASLNRRPPVRLATVAALPACTYNNGTGGVGATLTGNSNGALAAIDGVTPALADRLLIQDQVAALQNGVYVVTQVGNGGAPFILTRATDADEWSELVAQFVTVTAGTTNIGGSFVCDVAASGTVGTDALTWNPYSGASYISNIGQITDSVLQTIRSLPQNAQSANYEFQLSDIDKHILHPAADTTGRTFTIPANASVAFPIGSTFTIYNEGSAGNITIAITSDTLAAIGSGATGSRTLAANGVATLTKITSTKWYISGVNLS